MNIFIEDFNNTDAYFYATYYLSSSTSLRDAAWELAIGQSVGNPSQRSEWETESLYLNHSVIVVADEVKLRHQTEGEVTFAFPLANIDLYTDGIAQLLCQLMGGHLDIQTIQQCHLNKLWFSDEILNTYFHLPRYGMSSTREFTNTPVDRPLLGGIVKPKVVDSIYTLQKMVDAMVSNGINFIKEDEIMANTQACPSIKERASVITKLLENANVIYAFCINGDNFTENAKIVHESGGNGIHINIWSGLGSYKLLREKFPLFIHFQKSGDKIFTNRRHAFHIKWSVICYLASLMGVDSIHAGMWGGYMSDDEVELTEVLNILRSRDVIPALSCGMHPGLVNAITTKFGPDYMANVGGALHAHPHGTSGGVQAMRQAIDGVHGDAYAAAIAKWGISSS